MAIVTVHPASIPVASAPRAASVVQPASIPSPSLIAGSRVVVQAASIPVAFQGRQ